MRTAGAGPLTPAGDEEGAVHAVPEGETMKIMDDQPTLSVQGFRLAGHPGEVAPASGAYRCLCCGVVLWHVRKGRPFPECPSADCPTLWLWSEP